MTGDLHWKGLLVFILGFIILGLGIVWLRSSNSFGTTFISLIVMFVGVILIASGYTHLFFPYAGMTNLCARCGNVSCLKRM